MLKVQNFWSLSVIVSDRNLSLIVVVFTKTDQTESIDEQNQTDCWNQINFLKKPKILVPFNFKFKNQIKIKLNHFSIYIIYKFKLVYASQISISTVPFLSSPRPLIWWDWTLQSCSRSFRSFFVTCRQVFPRSTFFNCNHHHKVFLTMPLVGIRHLGASWKKWR